MVTDINAELEHHVEASIPHGVSSIVLILLTTHKTHMMEHCVETSPM